MTKSIAKAWSAEMTETVVSAYVAANKNNEVLAEIAKSAGKTVQAVRSKLVSEGVYKKAVARKVGGTSTTRKVEIVRAIETMLSLRSESLDSFEKASKAELELLAETLVKIGDKA